MRGHHGGCGCACAEAGACACERLDILGYCGSEQVATLPLSRYLQQPSGLLPLITVPFPAVCLPLATPPFSVSLSLHLSLNAIHLRTIVHALTFKMAAQDIYDIFCNSLCFFRYKVFGKIQSGESCRRITPDKRKRFLD